MTDYFLWRLRPQRAELKIIQGVTAPHITFEISHKRGGKRAVCWHLAAGGTERQFSCQRVRQRAGLAVRAILIGVGGRVT